MTPPQTPKELVAAIREGARLPDAGSVRRGLMQIPDLEARLRSITAHATRLAPLLAERDAAGDDMLAALEASREARLATGRQSTCDKQVHGDSHIQCGKCFICLERKALASARSGAPRPDVLGALIELLAMVDQSEGVTGWHLNGAIAPWSEFEFIEQLREAAQARGGA